MIYFVRVSLLVLPLLYIQTTAAQTEMKPQWEIGAGMAGIDFPVYRGAKDRRSYLLPIPYFVYRGEFLDISRERIRGLLFRRDAVEMDISVNGSVPANSQDSAVRQGMPDLDGTLEIGPSVNLHLYYSADKKVNFDLRMPLRTVTATDFSHFKNIGWLFQPQLALDFNNINNSNWSIGLVAGPIFSDQRYNQYFYDVSLPYVTAARPAYAAEGGYAGNQMILAINKKHADYWLGAFLKWDDLEGAVFERSPLVENKQYFSFGFAFTWVLGHSEKLVEVNYD